MSEDPRAFLGTKDEPSARTPTGEPIGWSRHWRWRIWIAYEGWYWFNQLEGVTWTCPNCKQQPNTVVLRERNPNRYWFQCRSWKCRWHERFNGNSGRDLVRELGVTPPSEAPKIPKELAGVVREHPEFLTGPDLKDQRR